jgi:LuxR family maltose regulon positive regulatory protein
LTVPPPLARSIARPRLTALLDSATQRRCTLLTAPAGWGKTTLLAAWAGRKGATRPVAWLSLDRGDDDPTQFWSYLVAAIRTAVPDDDRLPLTTLRPPRKPAGIDGFLADLVNALHDLTVAPVLVIDDVQLLTDRGLLAGLSRLQSYAPPTLSVVLSGRYLPPIPLGRLRVDGQVSDVRADDLAFTAAETRLALAQSDIEATGADARIVHERTEGWPAGVRLAAMNLAGCADVAEGVRRFSGDDRAVADYLVTEVLDQQPTEIREFLVRTCIVDRICPGLAIALTGRHDSAAVLSDLAASQVFVTALGPDGSWWRYHPLLAEVLRAQLALRDTDLAAELHARAATWFAANHLPADAVAHAELTPDSSTATRILADHWLDLFIRGDLAAVRRLLGGVPTTVRLADPEICCATAALRLAMGDGGAAEDLLRLLDPGLQTSDDRRAQRTLTAVRLYQGRVTGHYGGVLAEAVAALTPDAEVEIETAAGQPVEDSAARAFGLYLLGAAECDTGDVEAGRIHLRLGIGAARAAGHDYLAVGCLAYLSALALVEGRLSEAGALADQAIGEAEAREWDQMELVAVAYVVAAAVHCLRGEVAEADRALDHAELSNNFAINPQLPLDIGLVRTWVHATSGDPTTAFAMVAGLRPHLRRGGSEHILRTVLLCGAQCLLQTQHLLELDGNGAGAPVLDDDALTACPYAARLAHAQALLTAGQAGAAIAALEDCLDGTTPIGHLHDTVSAWLLAAVAAEDCGEGPRAGQYLERALATAEPEDVRAPFLAMAERMAQLLTAQVDMGTAYPDFVARLLDLTRRADRVVSPAWAELTDRETEVLRRLVGRLPNEEIARGLFITVNTVKTHKKAIYRKLEVSSVSEAVARARALQLL